MFWLFSAASFSPRLIMLETIQIRGRELPGDGGALGLDGRIGSHLGDSLLKGGGLAGRDGLLQCGSS